MPNIFGYLEENRKIIICIGGYNSVSAILSTVADGTTVANNVTVVDGTTVANNFTVADGTTVANNVTVVDGTTVTNNENNVVSSVYAVEMIPLHNITNFNSIIEFQIIYTKSVGTPGENEGFYLYNEYLDLYLSVDDKNYVTLAKNKTLFTVKFSVVDKENPRPKLLSDILYILRVNSNTVKWPIRGSTNSKFVKFLPTRWYATFIAESGANDPGNTTFSNESGANGPGNATFITESGANGPGSVGDTISEGSNDKNLLIKLLIEKNNFLGYTQPPVKTVGPAPPSVSPFINKKPLYNCAIDEKCGNCMGYCSNNKICVLKKDKFVCATPLQESSDSTDPLDPLDTMSSAYIQVGIAMLVIFIFIIVIFIIYMKKNI